MMRFLSTTFRERVRSGAESCEPIHDPSETPQEGDKGGGHRRSPSMAQRAKGFVVGEEGDGKVDMAAVLSGLGALPQESSTAATSTSATTSGGAAPALATAS